MSRFCAWQRAHILWGIFLWLAFVSWEAGQILASGSAAPPQQPGASGNEAIELEMGKPIERELASGQQHIYQVALAERQYLSAVVEQRGIDVAVRLLGPDGKLLATFDAATGQQGKEQVSQVAEAAGGYRLEVQAKQAKAAAGRYEIRLVERRAATEQERALHEARKLDAEAVRLRRAGKFGEALPLAERALTIRQQALGTAHPDVAQSLNNLATDLLKTGGYVKAESLYQRALAIWEKVLGPEHPRVAAALHNLANLYEEKGDYVKAEPLYQRALAIREKALGPEHPDIAAALNNLGILYYGKGDYLKAEPVLQRALAIYEKTLGPEHSNVAAALNNLALVYDEKGDQVKAEPLYQRALAIREKVLGPEHPYLATVLDSLSVHYQARGDYAKAEPLLQRALVIREKALGAAHPYVADVLNNLANCYTASGDLLKAVSFRLRAATVSERNLELNLASGSERQKLAYLATLANGTNRIISLHVGSAPADITARELALTTLFQRKGRALDAMSDSLAVLRRRANSQDQTLFDQLQEANAQLARLVLNGPERITPAEHQLRIEALEEQKEKLEAEISRRSAEFRTQAQPVTLAAVQAAIPTGVVLIEFFAYRPFDAKYTKANKQFGAPRYVAYVLPPQGAAQWVELGETQPIDEAIEQLRLALSDPQRKDVKELARALEAKVFQPVRALLGATTNVLLSPDGAFNLLPFAALVDEQGRYLAERYQFSYLTSGRDLLRLQVARDSQQPPLVLANPQFDAATPPALALAEQKKGTLLAANRRRVGVRGTDLLSLRFDPLSGTAEEAKQLKALFPQARVLTDGQATETALKATQAPRFLHIATHGFFLADTSQPVLSGTRGLDEAGAASGNLENPLLRSGLALAGANQRKGEGDDGILTALEAAGLNLWGTKLVVLSACETGVGEVKNGEGVYGLRRALVLAGAETQVMSLWKVDDYTTRQWMTAYYKGLLQGQGRGAALRQVQLALLREKRTAHPFYWASFIQSGEWAQLDGKR